MELSRVAAVTIDVDTLGCYRAVHGLPARDDADADPIYTTALPRFLRACDDAGVRATLFVIGRDLAHPVHRAQIVDARRRGHEIASHSFTHDYALSRRAPAQIDAELARASDAIADVAGQRPKGFRAPGYNLSEPLVDALVRHGFAYDSSIFPTPAYFAARASAIALHALAGRESRSLVGDVREFLAPRAPYHPKKGARHQRGEGEGARPLVEIPIGVASPLRLPWLGTSLALAPDLVGRALTAAALASRGPAVLELHGMDFLGHDDDGLDDALRRLQPDLAVDAAAKGRRMGRCIDALARARTVLPLVEIAALA